MNFLRWLIASRVAQWASAVGVAILAMLVSLSSARRRGARDARNQIEDDTDDHIIERHRTRDAIDRDMRADDADRKLRDSGHFD